jgi:hypothetical protein
MGIARIKHCSVSARDPERCARVLAELSGGWAERFVAPGLEGAWTCMWSENDELVEFLPEGVALVRGPRGGAFVAEPAARAVGACHVQLEISMPLRRVRECADRFGVTHGFRFVSSAPLYEVWLEERLLVELVSEEIRSEGRASC